MEIKSLIERIDEWQKINSDKSKMTCMMILTQYELMTPILNDCKTAILELTRKYEGRAAVEGKPLELQSRDELLAEVRKLQAENERLKGADDMVLIPKKLCPIVTKNGVSFGDVWFSHEKILGRKMTDNWEAGKPLEPKGLTEEQYFKWAAQMRALTNEVK